MSAVRGARAVIRTMVNVNVRAAHKTMGTVLAKKPIVRTAALFVRGVRRFVPQAANALSV